MAVTGGVIAGWASSAVAAVGGVSGAVAAVGAVVGIAGGIEQRNAAKRAAESSAEAASRNQGERAAQLAGAAANERRQQIRDERIKQARIMQAGENSGTAGSSGEAGALGSLATQLDTNIGFNLGSIASAGRQSANAQDAANFNFAGQSAQMNAGNYDRLFNLSGTIFQASYGSKNKYPNNSQPSTKPVTSIFENSMNNPVG
jgi:hypothetical protein